MSSGLNRSDISDSFEKVNMPKIFQQLTPFFFFVLHLNRQFFKVAICVGVRVSPCHLVTLQVI